MCGFLALFRKNNINDDDKELFKTSLKQQKQRGPDSTNINFGLDYMLGHNRLVILDDDPRSNQPFTKDGKSFLLYNGEIYNLSKLRRYLYSENIPLSTTSDTEVLYELLINYGIDKTLSMIEGMFSFLLYNSKTKKVIVAKDKFGQKPLFIYQDQCDLIFSSSLKSIINIKSNIELNIDAIRNYIFSQGHITPEQTFYKQITPLYAGHYLTFEKDRKVVKRYFSIENLIEDKSFNISKNDVIERLSEILSNSVKEHLNADCKVGILVSGGIDSMLINSFAEEHNKDLTGFTKLSSEIENIPKLINTEFKSNLKVQNIYPNKKNYLSRLFDYIDFAGRPAPWGGGPPLMDLCKKAREMDFKVLLSGDCVDEFSAGYLPSIKTLEQFNNELSVPDHLCLGKYCNVESSFFSYQQELRKRIMKNMKRSDNVLLDYFRFNSCQNIEFHLQETNLPHSDTFSMYESIELRNPYLDVQFVKFVLNLSLENIYSSWNINKKTGKFILKKLAKLRYANQCHDSYFLNKEGTRNYSYHISNKELWNLDKFSSLKILNLEQYFFDDWKIIFNLINLEIFLNINIEKKSRSSFLEDMLTERGKNELL